MPPPPRASKLSRRLTAPIAAFTMAMLLFVYARTSIRAAKTNAQRHREADGGQISWQRESKRRHGVLEAPVRDAGRGGTVGELLGEVKEQFSGRPTIGKKSDTDATAVDSAVQAQSQEEEKVRQRIRRRRD